MNYKNVKLILSREYFTRVTSKSFIWGTILTPIGIGLLMWVSGIIMTHNEDKELKIAVLDENQILKEHLENNKKFVFIFKDAPLDTLKAQTTKGIYNGVLLVPKLDSLQAAQVTALYYSDKQLGLETSESLSRRISEGLRKYKMKTLHIDQKTLNILKTNVSINPEPIDKNGKDQSTITTMVAAAIGGIMGFVMYIVVFVYGMMIMRSVMEEKTNRIVEVIMSSVKPIELMVGKILGVGAVGLTQLAFWMVLIPIILFGVNLAVGTDVGMMSNPAISEEMLKNPDLLTGSAKIAQITQEVLSINWLLILPLFIFYFLGGFFLYSSLFAAVGSAVGDDVGESQSLTLPISLPVIIALYIMMAALRDPNTNLAIWASIFPLFSPIVMPARLAFGPPAWQIVASVVSLFLGVWFFAWLSARIYRVGILLYGKKISFKELAKWMMKGE
ncbi:MAG TPA: ABC transporter permease [Saprospiraceae bacterium]|nr:ABC transporter permease [Saprospiraceae bacterium]